MTRATDKLLTCMLIFSAVLAACVFLYARACTPKPTPPPPATKTHTPIPPTFTPIPTFTATVVTPSDTPIPPSITPSPTFTHTPIPPTATPEPTATRSLCWYNWYAGSVVCYPRLNWHPKPPAKFLR